jgi:Zn-finger nucleic acid-binding protein
MNIRCPILTCSGWVCNVEEQNFFGCGECGNVWMSRTDLNETIANIVPIYSYRSACYVHDGKNFEAALSEPKDYDDLVRREWNHV